MNTIDRIKEIEKDVSENGKVTNYATYLWASSTDKKFIYRRFQDACNRGMNNFKTQTQ